MRSSIVVFSMIFIFLIGCSGTDNLTAPVEQLKHPTEISSFDLHNPDTNDYQLLFMGSMMIDEASNEITIIDRSTNVNIDITGFLGTNFSFSILSYVDEVMDINLRIVNPTALQVYDVRLIFTKLHGKEVLNPDNYTSLFAQSGMFHPNPQIAFAKDDDERAFPVGPGGSDEQLLKLHFPPGANPQVDFAIVASFPDQCIEPYEIFDKWVESTLTPSGGSADFSVRFKDHQHDVLMVACDTRQFTGTLTWFDYMYATDRYTASITNDLGAPPGSYKLLFGGKAPGSDVILYDYFDVLVVSETFDFETPREIDDPAFPNQSPDLITQGGKGINGYGDDIYVIYYITDPDGKQQVQFLRSTNKGDSFHYPATQVNSIDPESIHISPAMTVTPDGTIHAVWIRGDLEWFGSNMEYAKSTDGGLTFIPDIYMSGNFYELITDIAAHGNNNIYAVRNGAPLGQFSVFFQSSHNSGDSWSVDRDIGNEVFPTGSWSDMFPVMETDSKGNVFISFVSNYLYDTDPNHLSVFLARSTDKGNSFDPAIDIVGSGNRNTRLPCVTLDNNDRVYVLWVDLDSSTKNSIMLTFSDDGGNTFVPPHAIDDVSVDANSPIMRVDPVTNELYVGYTANGIRVQRSPDGYTWSDSVEVSPVGYHLNMYVDQDSRVHVSWGEDGKIKYCRSIR